jgi:outer membrane protein TolC
MRTFLPLLLAGCLAAAVQAQPKQVFTLTSAIERAQAESPSADVARLTFESTQWNDRAFQARYLPSLSLFGNGPGLDRAINDVQQDDGTVRYVPSSRTFSSVRMMVNQPITATGGNLSVSSGLSRIDLFGDFGSNQWQSAPLVVSLTQPILRFNQLKWERRAQPLRFEVARRTYAEALAQVAVETTDRFFDVYIAQMDVDNAAFNVAVNDTIYTLSEGRYAIGRIAENDLLQSELQLINAQTTLSNARIAYDRALQHLKLALDLPYDADVEILAPIDIPALQIDPRLAVDQAVRHSAAVRSMDLDLLEADQAVARARAENGFSADLTASYGLNQSAALLDDVYRNPLNQQRVNVSFQVPIFQWGSGRAEVQAARVARSQAERDVELRRKELEQEVYFVALEVNQLSQQVRIAAKADTIGARRFEVARSRYTIGNIDITDLFNAQREKDAARTAYIATLRQFWTSYYRLRRLTQYDFATGAPIGTPY